MVVWQCDSMGEIAAVLRSGRTRVLKAGGDQYMKNDGTWTAVPSTEYTATAWDGVHMPGVYYFDFSLPDAVDEYALRLDGGAGAANRYQYAWIEAVPIDEADMHKAKAALVNKQKQAIATGVVTIMDDDGATSLITLTPSVDDVDNPTENVLTPS